MRLKQEGLLNFCDIAPLCDVRRDLVKHLAAERRTPRYARNKYASRCAACSAQAECQVLIIHASMDH